MSDVSKILPSIVLLKSYFKKLLTRPCLITILQDPDCDKIVMSASSRVVDAIRELLRTIDASVEDTKYQRPLHEFFEDMELYSGILGHLSNAEKQIADHIELNKNDAPYIRLSSELNQFDGAILNCISAFMPLFKMIDV